MRTLNIDVNNLCCFMAQDKVGEFTQQDGKGILRMTLKNLPGNEEDLGIAEVGLMEAIPTASLKSQAGEVAVIKEKSLYDVQKELGDVEGCRNAKQRELENKKQQLDHVVTQIDSMQREVDLCRQRGDKQKLLERFEVKKLVMEAQNLKREVLVKQKAVEDASTQLDKAKESIEPLEERARELKKEYDRQEKSFSKGCQQLQAVEKLANRYKDNLNKDIQDGHEASTDMSEFNDNAMSLKDELAKSQKTLDEYLAKMEKFDVTQPKLNAELKALDGQKKECMGKIREKEGEIEEVANTLDALRSEREELSRQFKEAKDPAHIYYNKLRGDKRNMFKDQSTAMNFIAKNPNKFERKVYGPVGLHMIVRDPQAACVINDAMGEADLNCFIVQTDADYHTLKNIPGMRSLRIITIKEVESNPRKWAQYKSFYTNEQIRSFQHEFGFRGFAGEFIECDDIVKTYLAKYKDTVLSTVIVSTDNKSNLQEQHMRALCPGGSSGRPFCQLYLFEGRQQSGGKGRGNINGNTNLELYKYNMSFSRYSAAAGRSDAVKNISHYNDRINFLEFIDNSASNSSNAEIENRIRGITLQEQTGIKHHAALKSACNDLATDMASLRQSQQAIQKRLKEPEAIARKIPTQKKRIADIESKLRASNDKGKMKEMHSKLMKSLEVAQKTMTGLLKYNRQMVELQADVIIEEHAKDQLNESITNAEEMVEQAKRGLKVYENAKTVAIQSRTTAELKATEARQALEVKQQDIGDGTQQAFVEYYKSEIVNNAEISSIGDDIDMVTTRITELEYELKASVDNTGILETYTQRCGERDVLQGEVNILTEELNTHEAGVAIKANAWLTAVKNVIKRLNINFSAFMERLQFCGEVKLKETGTYLDYEIQLNVSFKENQAMSELSGTKHSGGERAVSTIMYLMSLQEVAFSPFRTVDEINQGMDDRNERLVFDQIVRSTCENSKNSQYFLVSPKLLPGLRSMEHENVTVLMIFNGPGVKQPFHLSEAVKQIKRKRHLLEDITNSGISNNNSDYESEEEVFTVKDIKRRRGNGIRIR